MNLFDKIKDTFTGAEKSHSEEAAPTPAEQSEYVPESPAAAEAQSEQEISAVQVEADAQVQPIAEEVAAVEADLAAEQVAAQQAAAEQVATEQAAAAPAEAPLLSVGYVLQLINHDADPNVATGDALDAVAGGILEGALAQVVDYSGPLDGALGTSFLQAYARFQESLGYSGDDADGYPGLASLTALAERTGAFRAVD